MLKWIALLETLILIIEKAPASNIATKLSDPGPMDHEEFDSSELVQNPTTEP